MTPTERRQVDERAEATTLIHQHCTGYRPATDAELELAGAVLGLSRVLQLAKRARCWDLNYAPPLVICQECRCPTDPADLYNFRGLVLCPDCVEDAEGRLNPEEAP